MTPRRKSASRLSSAQLTQYINVRPLANPENDATAIAGLFRAAGFDVVDAINNLPGTEMRRAFRDFAEKSRTADIAVVYYAGHGIEIDGTNYLLPVDTTLKRDIDVEDEAISLDRIVRMLEPAKRLRLIILDACRDNPFVQTVRRTSETRSVGRGLAKIEPTSSDTLIAFAARAGSTAADGDGKHSPFTTALLKNLTTPGLDLRIALGRVRDDVMSLTGRQQEPFVLWFARRHHGDVTAGGEGRVGELGRAIRRDTSARHHRSQCDHAA